MEKEKEIKEEKKEVTKEEVEIKKEIKEEKIDKEIEVKDTVTKSEFDKAWARLKKEQEDNNVLAQENKRLAEELKSIAEEKQKAEDLRLKKKEEYKTLAEKKEEALKLAEAEKLKLAEDKTNLLSSLEVLYEDMLNDVPEERRTLIPESLDITDKIKYLTANRKFLVAEKSSTTVVPTPKNKEEIVLDERTSLENRLKELQELLKTNGRLNPSQRNELWEVTKNLGALPKE